MKRNKPLRSNKYIHFFSTIAVLMTLVFALDAQETPKSFPVPLANVIPFFDSNSGRLDEVLITYGRNNEGWTISDLSDRYVKDTRRRSKEHIHREIPHSANLVTSFEAEQLNKVCRTFTQTLVGLEKDLARKNWGKCMYLDSHLSFFLRGFYYLVNAAHRSTTTLPKVTCISDSLFDTSPNSPKSDRRVHAWRDTPEHIIKLRISIRELVYQIKLWQKKDLANPKRNIWEDHSKKFAQAYELFIRYYFNFIPLPEVVEKSLK